jgi:hypothetical protein
VLVEYSAHPQEIAIVRAFWPAEVVELVDALASGASGPKYFVMIIYRRITRLPGEVDHGQYDWYRLCRMCGLISD